MPRIVQKEDNPAWKSLIFTAVLAPPCIAGVGMIAYFGLGMIISVASILQEQANAHWLSWIINAMLPILTCLAVALHIVGSLWVCRRMYTSFRWRPVPYDGSWCLTCGYNLTGNVSGICPECGEKIVMDEPSRDVAR